MDIQELRKLKENSYRYGSGGGSNAPQVNKDDLDFLND